MAEEVSAACSSFTISKENIAVKLKSATIIESLITTYGGGIILEQIAWNSCNDYLSDASGEGREK